MQVAPLTALMLLGTIAGACAAPECLVPTGEYLPTQVPYTYVLDRRSPFDQTFVDRYQEGIPSLIETGTLTPGSQHYMTRSSWIDPCAQEQKGLSLKTTMLTKRRLNLTRWMMMSKPDSLISCSFCMKTISTRRKHPRLWRQFISLLR